MEPYREAKGQPSPNLTPPGVLRGAGRGMERGLDAASTLPGRVGGKGMWLGSSPVLWGQGREGGKRLGPQPNPVEGSGAGSGSNLPQGLCFVDLAVGEGGCIDCYHSPTATFPNPWGTPWL